MMTGANQSRKGPRIQGRHLVVSKDFLGAPGEFFHRTHLDIKPFKTSAMAHFRRASSIIKRLCMIRNKHAVECE